MTYAIKNRKTGKFFSGFNGQEVVWSGISKAAVYADKLHATSQALCLRANGETAQVRPVAA